MTQPWPDPLTAKVIVVLTVATVLVAVSAIRADFSMKDGPVWLSAITFLAVLGFAWTVLHRVVVIALSDTPWALH